MPRTIQLHGYGFANDSENPSQSEIRIKTDGAVVFEGAIYTPSIDPQDSALPGSKDYVKDGVVAEWERPLDAATLQLEITALSGNFRFTRSYSNYMPLRVLADLSTTWSTGPDNFIPCYDLQESESVYYRDSNQDVKINGELQSRNAATEYERLGQWHWTVLQGQVFSSTMLISAGLESPLYTLEWNPLFSEYLIWRPNHDSNQ